jgi:hypothetical protein
MLMIVDDDDDDDDDENTPKAIYIISFTRVLKKFTHQKKKHNKSRNIYIYIYIYYIEMNHSLCIIIK